METVNKHYKNIDFIIDIEELPGKVVKYTALPLIEDIEPGVKIIFAMQFDELPALNDVDKGTLNAIHELTIKEFFKMIEVAKEKKILDWLDCT